MFNPDLLHQLQNQAHVWLVIPADIQDAQILSDYRELLSDDEILRYQRLRFDTDKHDFLVSHALLRTVLSSYADIAPDVWRFEQNEHGRPEIVSSHNCSRLRFNLSHTDGLVACVVTESIDCGVDVENLTRNSDYKGVARKMFSDIENQYLARLPTDKQAERFFAYWTLKEAYVKARGLGLTMPTRDVSFDLERVDHIRASFSEAIDDSGLQWQFCLTHPTTNHILATALRCGPGKQLELVYKPNALPC